MSSYITDQPFPVVSNVIQDIYCPQKISIGLNCSNKFNPYCSQQLESRKEYVKYTNSNHIRATIFPGPYPQYTSRQLDMRRKVEILQYKQNATTSNVRNWTRLATSGRNTSRACGSRVQKSKPSTASDVPFPIVDLFYDPTVPLYNYTPNPSSYNEFPYPDTINTTLEITIHDNVDVPESTLSTPIINMFYLSRPRKTGTYTLTVPMSILVNGSYYSFLTDCTQIIATITKLTLYITSVNTDSVVSIIQLPANSLSNLTVNLNESGSFESSFYVGAVTQKIEVVECPQINYNFSLRSVVNIVQKNSSGDTSVTPIIVSTSSPANVTKESPFFNTQVNCLITTNQPSYIPASYREDKNVK